MTINSCAKNFIYNLTISVFIEDSSFDLNIGVGQTILSNPVHGNIWQISYGHKAVLNWPYMVVNQKDQAIPTYAESYTVCD